MCAMQSRLLSPSVSLSLRFSSSFAISLHSFPSFPTSLPLPPRMSSCLTRAHRAQLTVARVESQAGGEYEGEGEFAVAQREARSFVGEKAWEAKKQASLDDGCRFRRDCHAQGYVKGGLVVGDAHFTGPDRYGADGAGPQMMKGKVGDNVVDVGIMGSAGTDDGDVMVPTGVSGARGRDLIRRRDAKDKGFPTLEDPVRRELVHGAAVARYGGPKRKSSPPPV